MDLNNSFPSDNHATSKGYFGGSKCQPLKASMGAGLFLFEQFLSAFVRKAEFKRQNSTDS